VSSLASRLLVRSLAYLWASPTSLLGLFMAALSLLGRGRARSVAGVLEAHGGLASGLLRRFPLQGGVAAIALGHVVVGEDAASLDRHRAHERIHVRQAERWGPLFLPAYGALALWTWSRGRHPYFDHPFEREARGAEPASEVRGTARRGSTGTPPPA
jgi:hypothetical protein